MKGPCLCGDTNCPWCGSLQSTYRPKKRKVFRKATKTRIQKKKILKQIKKGE